MMADMMQTLDLNTTISVLQQDISSISMDEAMALIDSWHQQLQGTDIAQNCMNSNRYSLVVTQVQSLRCSSNWVRISSLLGQLIQRMMLLLTCRNWEICLFKLAIP